MSDYSHTAAALDFLFLQGDNLIARVMEREFGVAPASAWSADKNARLRCLEDNRFHLHYLTASILAGNPRTFSDYCGWVKVVLQKRGIAISHLEENLKHWKAVLLASAPEKVGDVIVGYVDVALQHLPDFPAEPAPAVLPKHTHPLVMKYVELVLAFDAEGAIRLIESQTTDAASVVDAFVNVLQPAQREIGRLWQINSISVAVEHYATATATRILHRLSRAVPPRTRRDARLVGICGEGEHHCMGMEMVCSLCRLEGWEAHFLGPNTPIAAAVTFCKQLRPDVIGVSMTTLLALQNTRLLIARLKEALPHAAILAGGYAAGLGTDLWKTLGADDYAPDAISAVGAVERALVKQSEAGSS